MLRHPQEGPQECLRHPSTVLRTAILRGLRKYAPRLIRWFIICYGEPTRLFHSVHGFVGCVREGGKAGRPNGDDPLLGGAAGVAHPDQRARARPSRGRAHSAGVGPRGLADDVDLHGDGGQLLDNVDDIIRDLNGMELCLPKCTLLVGGGVVVEAVRAKAEELGIAVATEGTVVMGVPIGTDKYIEGALAAHVGGLLLDIAVLDYFTLHRQWTLLRMCVNQRPVYLQQLLQLRHSGVAFSRFDKAVTDKVLDVMGELLRGERELVLERVDALRCLPLQLLRIAIRVLQY